MLKPSTMLLKRCGALFWVLMTAAVMLSVWGLPTLAQEITPAPVKAEGTSETVPDKKAAPPEPSDETDQPANEEPMPPPSGSVEEWTKGYEKLMAGIRENSVQQEEVDQFFQQLDAAFDKSFNQMRETLTALRGYQPPDAGDVSQHGAAESAAEDVDRTQGKQPPVSTSQGEISVNPLRYAEHQSFELAALYKLRLQTLPAVSPALRQAITGTGIEGVRALKKEIDYLVLMARVRQHLIPRAGRKTLDQVISAPIPVLIVFFQMILTFFIFYWWRRWAKRGMPNLRTSFLEIKPRKWVYSWVAKLLWYLNRVRSPIEWAILLYLLLDIIRTSRGKVYLDLIWTNARLILVVWFVVLLVDAMSMRGAAGLRSRNAKLRLRSFWLLAGWALLAALGLGITEDLAGKGTIYAWGWFFSKLVVLPVLIVLLLWWRRDIYVKLEKIMLPSTYVKKILEHRKGLAGFIGAALGAAYLMMNSLRQLLLKMITNFEAGRNIIASLTRIEAIRVSEKESREISGEPIPEDKRNLLFDDDGGTVATVGRDTLAQMLRLVEDDSRGSTIVVVEHGGGKSFLLERLARKLEGRMLKFDCPRGDINAFKKAFADALELRQPDPTTDNFSEALQEKNIGVVAIDNIHLLCRPAFGGQQDMDRVADLVRLVQAPVLWFFTLDWAAWQYISRVRDSTLFLNKIIRMPLWSEEEIRELIERRSAHVGIEPDFSELVLPRQFEDIEHETLEERNRFGYFRILWNASDGNPVVSLHLWADSLRVNAEGVVKVALPQLPESGTLDNVSMTVLLVLRVIAQSGMANEEQIVDSLRLHPDEVASALTLSRNFGWIERIDNSYRLSWRWFRSVMMVLTRQNLLVRKI